MCMCVISIDMKISLNGGTKSWHVVSITNECINDSYDVISIDMTTSLSGGTKSWPVVNITNECINDSYYVKNS